MKTFISKTIFISALHGSALCSSGSSAILNWVCKDATRKDLGPAINLSQGSIFTRLQEVASYLTRNKVPKTFHPEHLQKYSDSFSFTFSSLQNPRLLSILHKLSITVFRKTAGSVVTVKQT